MTKNFDKILVFTDGACSGNPGPGGYGTVLVYPEGRIEELGGGEKNTTNNRMEMLATIRGLGKVSGSKIIVLVLTDSTYVIRGISQWIFGWKRKGWKTAAGKEVSNKDLWQRLDQLVSDLKSTTTIEWGYVRGHQGIPGNERCDEIAVAFSKGKYIELYQGDLFNYQYAIHDIPEDISIPASKGTDSEVGHKVKKKAYSYVSLVDGKIYVDKTWSECEARVKGRSGVKFKKSTSGDDEKQIIKKWS